MKLVYGEEARVKVPSGYFLCFETVQENPEGCSYIRFEDEDGEEVAYWVYDEWRESPQEVMGAIMGCLLSRGAV